MTGSREYLARREKPPIIGIIIYGLCKTGNVGRVSLKWVMGSECTEEHRCGIVKNSNSVHYAIAYVLCRSLDCRWLFRHSLFLCRGLLCSSLFLCRRLLCRSVVLSDYALDVLAHALTALQAVRNMIRIRYMAAIDAMYTEEEMAAFNLLVNDIDFYRRCRNVLIFI